MFPNAYFAPRYFAPTYFERSGVVAPPAQVGGGSRQRPAILPIAARVELRLSALQFSAVGVVYPASIRASAGLVLAAPDMEAALAVRSADLDVFADWSLGELRLSARGSPSRFRPGKSAGRDEESELFELYALSLRKD